MRALVISDIHANSAALDAILIAADGDYDTLLCLGDLVGYGPFPNEVIARIREVSDLTLAGNHDLAASGKLDLNWFSSRARTALELTIPEITREHLEYLRALDCRAHHRGMLLTHGSPADPATGYVLSWADAEEAFRSFRERISLHGHSHVPLAFSRNLVDTSPLENGGSHGLLNARSCEVIYGEPGAVLRLEGKQWLLNPGSVGFPRDAADAHSKENEAHAAARYGFLDLEDDTWTFCRVEYDMTSTAKRMKELGLW